MQRENPLFTKNDSPHDALCHVKYLISFFRQIQGDSEDEITLDRTGKLGLFFFLGIMEETIEQATKEIE
jgi:hypothetical protein